MRRLRKFCQEHNILREVTVYYNNPKKAWMQPSSPQQYLSKILNGQIPAYEFFNFLLYRLDSKEGSSFWENISKLWREECVKKGIRFLCKDF